jgi:hypothetical protein
MLTCGNCGAPLSTAIINARELTRCPECRTLARAYVFPASQRPAETGQTGAALLVAGESSCFYHPAKKAVIPCDECGRFLCGLCDVELAGRHYCPQCLEAVKRRGSVVELEDHRVLYDSMALFFAVLGLFICALTAPFAIYIAVRHWKSPLSLIPRTRWRFVVALVVASGYLSLMLFSLIMGFLGI